MAWLILLNACGGGSGQESPPIGLVPVTPVVTPTPVIPAGGLSLLAGNIGGAGFLDATGVTARFSAPSHAMMDAAANVYVIDGANIRMITPEGVVTSLPLKAADDDSTAFRGMTRDGNGNFYLTQRAPVTVDGVASLRSEIVKVDLGVDPALRMRTIAWAIDGGVNSSGLGLQFSEDSGICIDGAGNLYIADSGNAAIRKLTPEGVLSNFAGGTPGNADGTGSAAQFFSPRQMVIDGAGNLYVGDTNDTNDSDDAGDTGGATPPVGTTIRKITPAGVVTTLGRVADGGAGTLFSTVQGIAVDYNGNLFVSAFSIGDSGSKSEILKVTQNGVVSTLTGGASGYVDGAPTLGRLQDPRGIVVDAGGNLYIADHGNKVIRKISPAVAANAASGTKASPGVVSTWAGMASLSGAVNGIGAGVRFNHPRGLCSDAQGNLLVVDRVNHSIRKVTLGGVVTTLVNLAAPFNAESADGIACDALGNVYLANEHAVLKINSTGAASLLAGSLSGTSGARDGTGSAALFESLSGIAIDGGGNVFVSDGSTKLRKITQGGVVTSLPKRADATPRPNGFGVALDAQGNVYQAAGKSIQKISPTGVVSTLAGAQSGFASASIDGIGIDARFADASALCIDSLGNLYVIDQNRVRKVSPAGLVTTIAGGGRVGTLLGPLPGSLFAPAGIAIIGPNTLAITSENAVLKVVLP